MKPNAATDRALEEVVHAWLSQEFPPHPDLVDRMTEMALEYRAAGASVDETCAWVRALATSWVRHPSAFPRRLAVVRA